jgi:hypothetical protein
MRILFIGDVVGRPGRDAVKRWLPELRSQYGIDFTAANGENSAGGLGATPQTVRELRQSGVDALTMGNHVWRKKELMRAMDDFPEVVRPANYPEGAPGQGSTVVQAANGVRVGLVNLLGRVFMEPLEDPFRRGREEVERLREQTPIILVDMHAEATSEKIAMGWYLDGAASAVVGTHTHVQTADEDILPEGTAYITDIGMTGPFDSVIGVEHEAVIKKFTTGMPHPFNVSKNAPGLNAVVLEIDAETGKAASIERVVRRDEAQGRR